MVATIFQKPILISEMPFGLFYSGRSNGAFRVGVRFSNEDITFSMPSGSDVCDIGTFTIWCEAARSFFTRLAFPRSTFVSK